MIQRGRRSGLLLEPLHAGGIACELSWQELQSDLAAETNFGREPHLAHSTGPEGLQEFVGVQPGAGAQGHARL